MPEIVRYYRRFGGGPVNIPNDLTSAYCDRCNDQKPIRRKLRDIICDHCRIVLFSR